MPKIKIYGTAIIQKGEKRLTRKGKYIAVSRDKKGRFTSTRKWTPKIPVQKEKKEYKEIVKEFKTGKEAKEKVAEVYGEYEEWEDFDVESP